MAFPGPLWIFFHYSRINPIRNFFLVYALVEASFSPVFGSVFRRISPISGGFRYLERN